MPDPPRDFPLFHPACCFTDDSVCTLAVADALLGERDFAASLRAFVRRHPARGYGGMFLDWALTDDSLAYGSWGNEASMRVAAVGWLARDEAEALELAAAQAAVSHDHPDAIAAAQAVALAILLARGFLTVCTLDDLAWHRSPIQLNVTKMSAVEVIEQIRALPEEERAKVVRFVIEHEESWIPAEFREAMNEAAQGKMVNMERVMAGEKPPGA